MLNGYICQYWQKYNCFADGRITKYMHHTACITLSSLNESETFSHNVFSLSKVSLWEAKRFWVYDNSGVLVDGYWSGYCLK